MIRVIGPTDKVRENETLVNVTSQSKTFARDLSPFNLGPVDLYNGYSSKNMENAWQFSKVYPEHINNGKVTENYWFWAQKGWNDAYAHRTPMGKLKKPLFSLWKGQRLDYINARKTIYVPLYSQAVRESEAFGELIDLADAKDIAIFDYDSYDYVKEGLTLEQALDNPEHPFGHGMVLKMMLERLI